MERREDVFKYKLGYDEFLVADLASHTPLQLYRVSVVNVVQLAEDLETGSSVHLINVIKALVNLLTKQ